MRHHGNISKAAEEMGMYRQHLQGKLADYGIDDDFIRSLGSGIEPGTSALFVLVRKVNLDRCCPNCGRSVGRSCARRCRTSRKRS